MSVVADILDRAADIIKRNGFHKGAMFAETTGKTPDECPVCAWGALAIAAAGTPDLKGNDRLRMTMPAADALAAFLRLTGDSSMWTVPDWNDAPDRTADEVVAALEGAAAAERAKDGAS